MKRTIFEDKTWLIPLIAAAALCVMNALAVSFFHYTIDGAGVVVGVLGGLGCAIASNHEIGPKARVLGDRSAGSGAKRLLQFLRSLTGLEKVAVVVLVALGAWLGVLLGSFMGWN